MNKSAERRINPIVIIMVIFEIIFILFAVFALRNLFKKDEKVPNVGIEDYSIVPELSIIGKNGSGSMFELDGEKKIIIESVLYDEIKFNTVGNIYDSGAKIRKDSAYYVYISELNVYVLNFIVDIESLQQSYRVVYRWTDKYPNENIPQNVPVLAFCLNDEELIYGDFECRDKYNGHGEDAVVYNLLQNKTFDNSVLSLGGDVYNGEPLMIDIYIDSDDGDIRDVAVDEVSSYLASVGFDLADFNYEVSTNFVY